MPDRPPGTWDNAELVRQIRTGQRSVIAIDDTQGEQIKGRHPQRKAHAAVVVPRDRTEAVLHDMVSLRDQLAAECGTNVFHFRQLFHGKGPYEALERDQYRRLEILNDFIALTILGIF